MRDNNVGARRDADNFVGNDLEDMATKPDQTGEIRKLTTLVEVSQALSGTLDQKAALHRVLEILENHHGFVSSAVTLLRPDSREIYIEAACGLTPEGRRARYRLGEGITGTVVESGKPVVVPQASNEPLFLGRAASTRKLSRQEITFICVPITLNRKSVGALAGVLRYKKDRDYDRAVALCRNNVIGRSSLDSSLATTTSHVLS